MEPVVLHAISVPTYTTYPVTGAAPIDSDCDCALHSSDAVVAVTLVADSMYGAGGAVDAANSSLTAPMPSILSATMM